MNAIFRCLQHKKDFSQKIRIFCRLKFEATSGRLYSGIYSLGGVYAVNFLCRSSSRRTPTSTASEGRTGVHTDGLNEQKHKREISL